MRIRPALILGIAVMALALMVPRLNAQYYYGKVTSLTVSPSSGLSAGQTITASFTLTPGTEPAASVVFGFVSADGKYSESLRTTNPNAGTAMVTVGADWPNAVYHLSRITVTDALNESETYNANGTLPTENTAHPWFTPIGGPTPDLSGAGFTVTGAAVSIQPVALVSVSTADLSAGQVLNINYSVTGGTAPNWSLFITLLAPDNAEITLPVVQGSGTTTGTATLATDSSWINGTYQVQSVGISDSYSSQEYARGTAQVPTSTDFQLTGGRASAIYPKLASISLIGPSTVTLGQSAEINCVITPGSSPVTSVELAYGGPDLGGSWLNNWELESSTGGTIDFPIRADCVNGTYTLEQVTVVDSTGHGTTYYPDGEIIGFPVFPGGPGASVFAGNFTVTGALSIPPAISAQPMGGTVQPGQTLTLNVALANGPPPTSIQWYQGQVGDMSQPVGGNSSSFTPPVPSSTASYWAAITNAYGTVDSAAATITVAYSSLLPTIYTQPQPIDRAVDSGGMLTVYAAGPGPLTYQWYQDGVPVAGATSPNLVFNPGTEADSGSYTVVVTNPNGNGTSSPASVVFYGQPAIVTQPASVSVVAGGTATFSVQATGGDLVYSWSGPDASGADSTNPVLTLTNVQPSAAGTYSVRVWNGYGSIESARVTLTVTAANAALPVMTVPTAGSGTVGQSLSLPVSATNPPVTFSATGLPAGLSLSQNGLISGTPTTAGTFLVAVTATNAAGSNTASFNLTISAPPSAPQFSAPPQGGTVGTGSDYILTAEAPGAAAYQWYFNGQPIAGANGSSYMVADAQAAESGSYYVMASNHSGTVTSTPVFLIVAPPAGVASPAVVQEPIAQISAAGSTVVFNVGVAGSASVATSARSSGSPAVQAPTTYQWYLNGLPLVGATASTYVTTARSASVGSYLCLISNGAGTVTTDPATLSLAPANADPGRLINLSVLVDDGPGRQQLTVGFVSGGSTGAENVLLRVIGPTLSAFGVPNLLPDPVLTLFSGSAAIATNDQWAANQALITSTDSAVGAFALNDPASLDAALVVPLPGPGGFTVQAGSRSNASGTVLAEVYDATAPGTASGSSSRLINVSCNDYVGAGGVLTTGFTVGGSTSRAVLVRASGPALAAAPFNVAGTMPDPVITLFRNQTAGLSNGGWGGDAAVAAAAAQVGAFPWANAASGDSAFVTSLAPGTYTVQVTSLSQTAGQVLVEVYEVP